MLQAKIYSAFGFLLGDMFGSPFESRSTDEAKKGFGHTVGSYTDDTLMYLSVMKSFKMNLPLSETLIEFYDDRRGYGNRMDEMLSQKLCVPTDSWGNGAAVRTAALALYEKADLDTVEKYCRTTHTHPDAVRTSLAMFIAVRNALNGNQDLSECWKIIGTKKPLKSYSMGLASMESIPPALIVFEQGKSFENVLKNAVSLGGDTDSIGAAAGALAGACFGIPDSFAEHINREKNVSDLMKKYLM